MSDLKFAIRRLFQNPGFTAIAALTLSIGVGCTVAIYGVVNELLFKPRAVSRPDELVAVGFQRENGSLTMINISRPFYEMFHSEQRAFSNLIGFAPMRLRWEPSEGAELLQAELASGAYFETLGVRPRLGRTLLPADDATLGAGAVAVISHRLWQNHFQSDLGIVGQRMRLEGHLVEIIGVAAEDFTGLDNWSTDLWIPTTMEPAFDKHTVYRMVGRLRPEVSRDQAQADIRRVALLVSEVYGERSPVGYEQYGAFGDTGRRALLLNAGHGSLSPFYDKDVVWRAFFLFMGAGTLVLLIGCTNFANLLLSRALRRRKETATRLALGGTRFQIVKASIMESCLLAGLGGVLGVLFALWMNRLLLIWKPDRTRFMAEVTPDWRVLGFCALVVLATGLLCGLIPAIQSVRFNLFPALKNESASLDGNRRRFQFKHWLVSAQLALSLVLIMGAGLCLWSLGNILSVDPGFDTRKTIVAALDLKQAGYSSEEAPNALRDILRRIQEVPGVARATFSWNHPLSGGKGSYVIDKLEGYESKPGERIEFDAVQVGPDFGRTLGMPLIRGTELSLDDYGTNQRAALVNESFKRRYWPNETALGKHIIGLEVIGVVKDTRVFDLTEEPAPLVFRQMARLSGHYTNLLIQTDDDPKAAMVSIVSELRSMNFNLAAVAPETIREIAINSLGAQRYTLALLAGFAVMALLLATVGVYGVTAYMARMMTKEFGIRMAMGADKKDIVSLVFRVGFKVVGLGALMGLPLAAFGARYLRSELYEVHPLNPFVFAGALAVLMMSALGACWLPARRAASIEPMEALRNE